MSSTPEENQAPEQPRWGQRRPADPTPGHQPEPGWSSGPGQQGQPTGGVPPQGHGHAYGQPSGSVQPQQSHQFQPGHASQFGGGHPGSTAPAQKPKRPMTLIIAMVLMLLAGASALVLSILSFLEFTSVAPQDIDPFWAEVVEESQAQQPPDAEELTAQDLMGALGFMVLLGGIILAALYTVFAFVGTMTGNVGRILATIFLSGSVFMILFGAENLIVTGLSLGAIVALWLPASNTFVRDRKTWKELSRGGSPYGGPGQPAPPNPQGWPPAQGHYQQSGQQQAPYQQGPYQQGPYQQAPYQQGPYQQGPEQRDPYGSSPDSAERDSGPYDGPTPR